MYCTDRSIGLIPVWSVVYGLNHDFYVGWTNVYISGLDISQYSKIDFCFHSFTAALHSLDGPDYLFFCLSHNNQDFKKSLDFRECYKSSEVDFLKRLFIQR